MCPQLRISLMLLLTSLLMCTAHPTTTPASIGSNRFSSKTFRNHLGCQGTYDQSILSKLDRVCDSCNYLYKFDNFVIYGRCRTECFSSVDFASCLQVLDMGDEQEEYKKKVELLNGVGRGFEILPSPATESWVTEPYKWTAGPYTTRQPRKR